MKPRSGFTLVEILLYITIFAVVGGLLVGILVTNLKTQDRNSAENEVTQQLDFVLSTVQRLVRNSSLIEAVYEGSATTTDCSTYCTLKLRMEDDGLDPTIIRSDQNGVYLKEGSGDEVALTTGQVTVDDFRLSKFEVAGGHAALQVDASFTYNSSKPELAITKSLQSAISRVTAATFDSDLIPNLNNAWDIGQIAGNKWQNGYFAGTLAVGINSSVQQSAAVQIDSDSKGLLLPRLNATSVVSSPVAGLIIFNTAEKQFYGYDGISWSPLGGDNDWIISGNNMYSNVSGYVGIGEASPSFPLEVKSPDASIGSIGFGGLNKNIAYDGGTDNLFKFANTGPVGGRTEFIWNESEPYTALLTIENGGDVGIGTTNPSALLDIDAGTGRGIIEVDGSSGGCLKIRDTDDAGWTYCTTINGTLNCSTSAC